MKRLLLLGAALLQFALVAPVFAVPCVSQTLASFIALGAMGCTIDGVEFSDFTEASPLQLGATRIDSDDVTLTPITGTSSPGFSISSATAITADPGELFELFFGFNATPAPGFSFTSNTIALDSSAVATDEAAIIIVEDKCLNGMFSSPSFGCSSGDTLTLIVFAIEGISELTQTGTSPATFFDVFIDLIVDGGPPLSAGGATLGPTLGEFRLTQVGSNGTAVPEPASWMLLLIALLALGGLRWLPHSLTRANRSTLQD